MEVENMGAILTWIIIGGIAGGVANLVVNRSTPGPKLGRWVAAVPLGIVGALVGGFIFALIGIGGGGIIWTTIIGTIGAIIVTWVYNVIVRRVFRQKIEGQYDVFISYRREQSMDAARLISNALREHKLRTFLDIDELGPGRFDQALLTTVANTPNLVVILAPHALDRSAEEHDWLQQEVSQAIQTNSNIVPVMMPGFQFPEPEELPEDLRNLPNYQGVGYSSEFFKAMIDRLSQYIKGQRR
jgi:uncharacterized membrane protein YeaQ/YmgE (transglycosylase-associated protein family)